MNLILPAVIAGAVGVVVFVGFVTVRFLVDRIHRWRAPAEQPLLANRLTELLASIQPPRTLGERLDRVFERMVGRSSLELTGMQAAALLMLVAVAAGAVAYLWQPYEELAASAAAAAAAFGLQLAFFWLMHWRWRRQAQELLPDTFHLLARSLRAGLTVDQSLALIVAQGPAPLAGELKRCVEHLRLGMTVPAALDMTAGRLELADFDLLVALVALHRDTGGNLALLVDRLASTVRSRNHFRGHVAAVTALSRITGLCLALAPPALLVFYWFIYPEYVTRLTQTSQGLKALGTALALEVVGVLWLTWLLRIDN